MGQSEHLSKKYDQDLETLRSGVLQMGGLVEAQIRSAIDAFANGSQDLIDQVIASEGRVNECEVNIDNDCSHIIVKRQPAANDLRMIMAISKAVTDLERIGDEAEKIARMSKQIHERGRMQPQRFPNAPTCVWPLEELGLVELMQGEHSITRELTAVPTPGHTPGHVSILITSGGERALVLGDAAHSPVQIHEPDWVSRADMDPELTRQTRRALLDRLEREEIIVAAGHFQAPGFGRIVRLQGRRYWQGL